MPSRQVNTSKSQERRANKRVSNLNCITPPTLKTRSKPNSNPINILCWTIRGISTKLQDKRLRDYLSKFSIIGFVVTMKDKHFAVNINGFVYYNFPRKHRHYKAKRASRGIGILIANWLNKSVQIKQVNDCLVWITIKHTGLTNLKQNVMIGIVYIPPRESSHTVKDDIGLLDTLESEFAKYSTSCHVMYCVVDYLLTPYTLLNLIFNFQIGPKHIDSDHRPITFTLQIHI